MNLALYLTIGRILLSPIFLSLYLFYQDMGISFVVLPFLLLFVVILAELSDLLDGIAARRNNEVTELGKILDPMADSIFRLSFFFALTQGFVKLPLWLVLFFFYRDSVVSILRTVCALRGIALAARMSGKIKAAVQGTAAILVLALMVPYVFGMLDLQLFRDISFYIVLAAALYTVFSGVEYIIANLSHIKAAFQTSQKAPDKK
ncbi:MAG TPA: CDP-alcohol phosphatidyltransferase family protein [Rhabdochlamydiaceae bacterium]|nr:CDP-alcohol phosphatidyltransferase family protein [Rhabdochlamydiaceae bacterium]